MRIKLNLRARFLKGIITTCWKIAESVTLPVAVYKQLDLLFMYLFERITQFGKINAKRDGRIPYSVIWRITRCFYEFSLKVYLVIHRSITKIQIRNLIGKGIGSP